MILVNFQIDKGYYRVQCDSATHLEGVFLYHVSKQYQLQQNEEQPHLPTNSVEGGPRYVGKVENGKFIFMTIFVNVPRIWTKGTRQLLRTELA